MTFDQLGLIEPILKALATEGYERPTPIQEQAIPILLQQRDLLGCAQTGTGKTAAFALPILQLHHLAPVKTNGPARIKTLILTPTRELAIQIGDSFKAYGRHTRPRYTVIFGGVGQTPQTEALKKGVEILIATPGRLLDLMNQGYVHLSELEIFVLDEADRMLDMGFIHDVRKVIAKLPAKRQTLFFSATMPPEIQKLADNILNNPQRVAVTPVSSTAETVTQSLYFVEKKEKKGLLVDLLQDSGIKAALVFSRTKHGANKIAKDLLAANISAEAIHGNKSQSARQTALSNFKTGRTRVLVATDIAARGIDIDELAYVVNYDLPNIPETYVHRIGRTGRAGASGAAISFCDREERAFLRDIEKLIGKKVPVAGEVASSPDTVEEPDNYVRKPQQRQQKPERREQPAQRPQQQERREQHNAPRRDAQPQQQRQPSGQRLQQNDRREQNNGPRRDAQPQQRQQLGQRPQQNDRREQSNAPRRDAQPQQRPQLGQRPQQNDRREQSNAPRRDAPQQQRPQAGQRPQQNDRRGNSQQRPLNSPQPKLRADQLREHQPKQPQTTGSKVDWDDLDDLMTW
jgi:ATP-dependent RNA helicase RhlE